MGLVTENCVRLGEDTTAICWSCDTAGVNDGGAVAKGAVEGGGGFEDDVAPGEANATVDKDKDGGKEVTAAAAAVA
jgi:hypothetical protein